MAYVGVRESKVQTSLDASVHSPSRVRLFKRTKARLQLAMATMARSRSRIVTVRLLHGKNGQLFRGGDIAGTPKSREEEALR